MTEECVCISFSRLEKNYSSLAAHKPDDIDSPIFLFFKSFFSNNFIAQPSRPASFFFFAVFSKPQAGQRSTRITPLDLSPG